MVYSRALIRYPETTRDKKQYIASGPLGRQVTVISEENISCFQLPNVVTLIDLTYWLQTKIHIKAAVSQSI